MAVPSSKFIMAPSSGVRPWLPWALAGLGLLVLYGPTLLMVSTTIWLSDEQGHGPIVLALSIWLLQRKWRAMGPDIVVQPARGWGWAVLAFGALLYVFGRSQDILIFEVGSLVWMIAGLILTFHGFATLKALWFPLFFMCFMVPLPSAIVDALTQPMKLAVSYAAESILYQVGYPISRSGVILQIGPYQLLVADACAGLHTLFTLEALGLLYLNVVRHTSAFRNIALAILIVPISFIANVIRVMTLTLVTYHLGDEAGQGFLHGFAGMVLFLSALFLIIGTDGLLRLSPRKHGEPLTS